MTTLKQSRRRFSDTRMLGACLAITLLSGCFLPKMSVDDKLGKGGASGEAGSSGNAGAAGEEQGGTAGAAGAAGAEPGGAAGAS